MPERVRELHLENKVNQSPDAILTAHANWVSKVEVSRRRRPQRSRPATTPSAAKSTLLTLTDTVVRAAVGGQPAVLTAALEHLRLQPTETTNRLVETVGRVAAPFGPDHMESSCGFKVRGSRITHHTAAIPIGDAELLGPEGDLLRVWRLNGPVSVVLRFEGGTGTVIPALPGYIAALTFEDGDLVDVAYEPSANTGLWNEYAARADEAALLARRGCFGLAQWPLPPGQGRRSFGDRPQDAVRKNHRPHTGDLCCVRLPRPPAHRPHPRMTSFLRPILEGNALFDLELLTRSLVNAEVNRDRLVIPFIPLFSQGWHLLRANRVRLHPILDGIEATMRESVWSLFEGWGVEMLERALMSKEVL